MRALLLLALTACAPRVPPPPAALEDAPAAPAADASPAEVIARYYALIDAGDPDAAWRLWADEGAASGQPLAAFREGFADTAGVRVDVGPEGRREGAAGSVYVEVPVEVTATHRDGSVHRFAGSYTLRRSTVDGATPDQRAWRLLDATLREVG